MKIETKKNTYDDISLDSIENTWSEFNGSQSFDNYNIVNNTNLIAKLKPNSNSCLLYSKISTLNEIINIGKKFYEILKPEIISNYPDILSKPKERPEFVDLNNQNKFVYDTFINKFITNKNLEEHFEKISEIILNYCKENGLPLVDDISTFFTDDNPNETFYTCEIKPFISLSIIIYIINKLQMTTREIIDFIEEVPHEDRKCFNIGKISSMIPQKWYCDIDKQLQNLNEFQWFLDLTPNSIYEINLKKVIFKLTEKINYIDYSTSYLKISERVLFSENNKKFFIIESHNNIMSIAWHKLKTSMFSYYGYITKKCKKCDRLFETENKSESFCSEICKNYSSNINSAKSYEKLKILHQKLKSLFKKCDKNNFDKLDSNIQENIIKYSNLKITELKKIKDKDKTKNLEYFINILSNL